MPEVVGEVEVGIRRPEGVPEPEGNPDDALAEARDEVQAGLDRLVDPLEGNRPFENHDAGSVHRGIRPFDVEKEGVEMGKLLG